MRWADGGKNFGEITISKLYKDDIPAICIPQRMMTHIWSRNTLKAEWKTLLNHIEDLVAGRDIRNG